MTSPIEADIAARTDVYFKRTKAVVQRFGDRRVTYAIFLRRPVVSAPVLMLDWLRTDLARLIPEDGSTPEITIYCTEDGEKPAEDADEPVDQLRIQVEKIEDRRVEWAKVTLLPARTEADRDEPKKD